MYMTWLKNGFARSHLAWLFKISKSTFTRYLITWTNCCYFSLGAIPIWPSREAIDSTMPQSFKNTYPSTRCIIDCTELFCQRPSSLRTQSCMYSHYKNHVTYKVLLGRAPSGGITFISQLYDGSISDKEIVRRSGILDERFWQPNDSVMADRGFTIDEELKQLKVNLNIPAFLGGRTQLTKAEVKESQTITYVRIEIPLTFHGSINQIWTVCCLLCNFVPPLSGVADGVEGGVEGVEGAWGADATPAEC